MVLGLLTDLLAFKMLILIITAIVHVIWDGKENIVLIITVHVTDIVHPQTNIHVLVLHHKIVSNAL